MTHEIVSAQLPSLVIDSQSIRREGAAPHEMWCLTDLWRAAGSPDGKRPANWLRKEGAQFVEFVRDSWDVPNGHIRKKPGNPNTGDGGSIWGHWQIALAYAKALSHPFHARVNEVYRAFCAGQLAPIPRGYEHDLITLSLLRAPKIERRRAWDLELKLELARLRKIEWDGRGVEPKGLAFAYGRTWRIILGDVVYDELKLLNPEPREGSLHSAWLQDRRFDLLKESDMPITSVLARRCTRWREFESEMRSHFRRAPIQLRLVAGQTSKKLGA